jgi:hypothetical protein
MEYYRQVKIAGEDVVEEAIAETEAALAEPLPGFDEETRTFGASLADEPAEENLAE